MAANIATAAVFITGNITGLNKALGDAERRFRGSVGYIQADAMRFANGMGSIGRTITKFSLGGLGVLAGGAVGIIQPVGLS